VWTDFSAFAQRQGQMPAFRDALVASVDKLLETGPAPLLYVRGVRDLYVEGSGALDKASQMLYEQYRRYPQGSPLARSHLGWALQIVLEHVNRAAEEGVELCDAYLNLGIMLNDFEQYDLAEQLLPRAIECAEGVTAAHAGMHWSRTMLATNRPHEALNLLRDLRKRFPGDPDLRLVYAQTLARTGQAEEAVAEYNMVLETPLADDVRERIEKERDALL
jgi:tetratricopeptide (TPR) repeat protein